MPDANTQRQLALALAEQERRRRMGSAQVQPEQAARQPRQNMAQRFVQGAGSAAQEINAGMLGLIPGAVPALQSAGLMRSDEEAKQGPLGAAARYAGSAIPFAAGIPLAGTAPGQIPRSTGIFRSMVDDIANFARNRPKTYFGTELSAAGAAGAAGQVAKDSEAGVAGQLVAEVAGGLVGGGLVAGIPAGIRATREGLAANLAPMTTEGGMIRASRQMQERAGGQDRAQKFATMLDTIPEGVTPAQWIGDSRLMAQEARLLMDNPDLEPVVRQELQDARLLAQNELLDSFGRPRSRQDWEFSVLQRVTPQGAKIDKGQSDEMLDSAYRSFEPLYDQARGIPVEIDGLKNAVVGASKDDFIMASDGERDAVARWLSNQMTAIEGRDVPLTSDDLLNLRSRIRSERRKQMRSQNMERADLLNSAEAVLTQRIEDSLPDDVRDVVRAADSQYRKYKVVESAIFSAGDRNLTPDQLSEAIRMGGLTTQSQYARGQDPAVQELREIALSGRSTEEVIGDPRRASMFVRGMDDQGKKAVQADFINTLFTRAAGQSASTTDAGVAFVSGRQLTRDIQENRQVMKALGMSDDEIGRTFRMAREISVLEQKPPAAVDQLFEDGPASIMQLAAALVGAKQGQAIAGNGMGSSLVMAQYMSNRARRILAGLTSNEAERLMKEAATDPVLYRAMLTKNLSGGNARQDAAYLESWFLASAMDKAGDNQ
jgi:hypothetical protein